MVHSETQRTIMPGQRKRNKMERTYPNADAWDNKRWNRRDGRRERQCKLQGGTKASEGHDEGRGVARRQGGHAGRWVARRPQVARRPRGGTKAAGWHEGRRVARRPQGGAKAAGWHEGRGEHKGRRVARRPLGGAKAAT